MTPLRAHILAAFYSGNPVTLSALRDHSITVQTVADWLVTEGEGPERLEAVATKSVEVEAECEAMKAEGILGVLNPLLMDHHKALKGVYTLTQIGAQFALAVIEANAQRAL